MNPNSKIGKTGMRWHPNYWLAAAAIPMILFAFDAVTNSLYPETRAHNGPLSAQLAAMFLFYSLWVIVPVWIWRIVRDNIVERNIPYPVVFKPLLVNAAILCLLHLLLLTVILRLLYSPPGWGLPELIYSFGEVFLSYAAIWMIAYGTATLVIISVVNNKLQNKNTNARYEIRHNGKIWSIDHTEIYWIKAAGNYAELHTAHGCMMVRKTLGQIGRELDNRNFISSHRSALINGQHVVSIKPKKSGDSYQVELTNDDVVPLSRRNNHSFRDSLGKIQKI